MKLNLDSAASAPARTVIVCDWLPPATNAVGQYMFQRALEVARLGGEVTLIGLGDGDCVGEERRAPAAPGEGVVTIIRLRAAKTPRASLIARSLWTLDVLRRLVGATAKAQRGGACEIVVTGSPPFLSYILIVCNRLFWRRALTYRIMDFYPEVVFAAGKMRALQWSAPIFQKLRAAADRVEALGDDQKRRLVAGGLDPGRVGINRLGAPISIGPDDAPGERPFEQEFALLLYSGNLGVAHEIETFCEAYRRHVQRGSNRVRLWLNGAGARVEALRAYCEAHNLPLAVTPPAPLEKLPGVMMAADAHLVLLDRRFWGYVHPSKIYGCLEAGQPVLYVGPGEADIAALIKDQPNSVHVENGDAEAGFAALEQLAAAILHQRSQTHLAAS